ncbi:TraY domain-containing protein (plasmid) [Escherichia coli]|nr:TraY domain-containing protein [Escherichia coli]MDM5035518.1 TraY domain-containing protein [Escherichia coli]
MQAKNRSGWCKTDEAADRVIDHLIKFPDFYNSRDIQGGR